MTKVLEAGSQQAPAAEARPATAGPRSSRSGWVALGVFGAALAVYVATLAPGLLWGGGDFATFQTRLYTGEVVSTIFGHPLWVILARPFLYLPVRDVAYRANLASAVFGAAALALVFLAARRLARRTGPALLATAALGVSHTFWTYAVMPKVYSLNALLLAACLCLLLRWGAQGRQRDLAAFGVLFGLSLLNHLVMATAAAGFAAYIAWVAWYRRERQPSWQPVAVAAVSFLVGLLPYLWLLAQQDQATATSGTVWSFVRGFFTALTNPVPLGLGIAAGAALLVYQFPLTLPAAGLGLRQLWRAQRAEAWLLLLVALGDVMFLLGATDPRTGGDYVWNLHYYLQAYLVVALWLAVGLAGLWPRLSRTPARLAAAGALVVAVPIASYALAPIAARPFVAGVPGFRELPGRDNLRYVLAPWKHQETGARPFGEGILRALPAGSQLFADYSIWTILNYLQVVEGARPDVRIYNLTETLDDLGFIQQHAEGEALYLADTNRYYDMAAIKEAFEVVEAGPVYRLVRRPK